MTLLYKEAKCKATVIKESIVVVRKLSEVG